MKTGILAIAFALFTLCASAQDRWTVQLNSKVLLTANTEDTLANVIVLDDLKKGSLIVTFNPGKAEGERKRRLMVYDEADNELYTKEAFSITIPVGTLKKWKLTLPRVKVYTLPVLEEPAGTVVRLRRVHLCTINFTD